MAGSGCGEASAVTPRERVAVEVAHQPGVARSAAPRDVRTIGIVFLMRFSGKKKKH